MLADPKVTRLLAIMAHPDDVEFTVAGTLFHLKNLGWELGIVTMTGGDCGSSTLAREEISRIRTQEARAAADYLGATYACVGFMDLEVFFNAGNLRKVVDVMRRFDPDVVITHSPADYLLDHEETSRLVRGACFALSVRNYETATQATRGTPSLFYADPIEGKDLLGTRVYPQFYVNISEQLAQKSEMLACHASQREWLRAHHGVDEYLEQMTAWASNYGQECGFSHAEGFRQHLGHGYPPEPILQTRLQPYVRERDQTKSLTR